MKRLILLALVAVLALAGCAGTGVPTKNSSSTDSSSTDSSSSSATQGEEGSSQSDQSEETTSSSDSLEKCSGGETDLGDWHIKITKVILNANSVIKSANMFNDKPKAQYVLVTYKATYNGSERKASVDTELNWTLTDSNKVVHDRAYAVTPYSDKPTEARQGGTVTQQVLFDARPSGAILSTETMLGDEYGECLL